MRRWWVAAVLVVLVVPVAWAFQNEPNGWRGHQWGCPIGQVAGLELLSRDEGGSGIASYAGRPGSVTLAGCATTSVVARAYRGRFYLIQLSFASQDSPKLREHCVRTFGSTRYPNSPALHWEGPHTTVNFSPGLNGGACIISIYSTRIERAIEAQQDRADEQQSIHDAGF